MSDEKELIRRLSMVLDGCVDLLAAEAEREKRREAGKRLRQITMQQRHEGAIALLDEAEKYLGGV